MLTSNRWRGKKAVFGGGLLALNMLLLAPSTASAREPARATVIVRLDCESEVARKEITLFANGTVRLRERSVPQQQLQASRIGVERTPREGELLMYLGELDPELMVFYLDRLRKEDLSEVEERPGGLQGTIVGEWVDQCSLELALPGLARRQFSFSQYASLPLTLSRVVAIVLELPRYVVREDGEAPRIPTDYQGELGDVLERNDGQRFEVVGFTADDVGLELLGVDVPITLFIALGDLRQEFRALMPRDQRGRPGSRDP